MDGNQIHGRRVQIFYIPEKCCRMMITYYARCFEIQSFVSLCFSLLLILCFAVLIGKEKYILMVLSAEQQWLMHSSAYISHRSPTSETFEEEDK